jgi:uncharacterized membrane protein HdeD (DUF308 family)
LKRRRRVVFSYGPPWKQALIGAVAVFAGVALLLSDWSLAQLVSFVAMFFVGRGALHLVTMSFEGMSGALSALLGCGEVGIGVLLLAWPDPTLLVLVAVVGVLVLVRGVVTATVVLATRPEHEHWRLRFASAIVELALGVTLIAQPGGTVQGASVTLGVLALLEGVVEFAETIARGRAERLGAASMPLGSVSLPETFGSRL